ncbi:MAG TPA: hypothetical protein V6C65_10045 [Allocoleopsis sp.]
MPELAISMIGRLLTVLTTLMAVQSHIRGLKREWQSRLQAEIDRNSDAKVKSYAAERDFGHLKNNQEQMREAIKLLQSEVEALKDTQIELKVMMNASYTQIQMLTARFSGDSSMGWTRGS